MASSKKQDREQKLNAANRKKSPRAPELERMITGTGMSQRIKTIPTASLRVFGIVANTQKPRAVQLAQQISAWLTERHDKEIILSPDASVDAVVHSADFIITIGGDGTILNIARHMLERPVPVFGINLGRLGFLTGALAKDARRALDEILKLPLIEVEPRLMLRARILRDGEYQAGVLQALNDAVINREGMTRYMKVEISVGEESFSHFFGDGVIISTPTGSTAYSVSAGGPVVLPTLDNIVVTPICPHASALRSIVLPAEEVVRVRVFSDKRSDRMLLSCDGENNVELEWGDIIECTRSPIHMPIVKSSRRKYFRVLHEKFKIPLERSKRI